MVEKATNELDGDFSRILDVVRCSVVVLTEEQLESVAQTLKKLEEESCRHTQLEEEQKEKSISRPQPTKREQQQQEQQRAAVTLWMRGKEYVVVRLKNRFKTPKFNGYRDALYSIVVNCGGGGDDGVIITHVCEVQLHLADIVAHGKSHGYYEYFRTYFSGSGKEESRMQVLQQVRDFGGDLNGSVDHMIGSILRGSDLEQLEHLANLIEDLMGDVKLGLRIRERMVQLDEGRSPRLQVCYAVALQRAGQSSKAEHILRMQLEMPPAHAFDSINLFNRLATINNLAAILKDQGKLADAESLFRKALDDVQNLPGNPKRFALMGSLALMLKDQGKFAEAEPLLREALCQSRRLLGNLNPDTLVSICNLASLLQDQGKLSEAEPLLREACNACRRHLGNSHPMTFSAVSLLATLLQEQGKLSEAESMKREVLDGSREQLGNSHPSTFPAINNYAMLLKDQGKRGDAEPLLREALDGCRQRCGNTHPMTLSAIANLATLFLHQGRLSDAEPLLREALDGRRRHLGNTHPDTLSSIFGFAILLVKQRKYAEAKPLLSEALVGKRQQLGESHPSYLFCSQVFSGVSRVLQGEVTDIEIQLSG